MQGPSYMGISLTDSWQQLGRTWKPGMRALRSARATYWASRCERLSAAWITTNAAKALSASSIACCMTSNPKVIISFGAAHLVLDGEHLFHKEPTHECYWTLERSCMSKGCRWVPLVELPWHSVACRQLHGRQHGGDTVKVATA